MVEENGSKSLNTFLAFNNGIHVFESLALHFLVVDASKSINFELKGLFVSFLLSIESGSGDLFTKRLDVGKDVFATAGVSGGHLFKRSESLVEVISSDSSGVDEGSKVEVVFGVAVIGVSLSGTFFRCSNVDFIELESTDLALDKSKEPSGGTDSSGFKEEGKLKEDKDNRVAQESNWEASSNQLPCNRSKDGGGNGSHESKVEELLDSVGDTEDVFVFTDNNVDGGNTGNDEEAKGDSHLTTAHESRKILSAVLEETLASSEGHRGRSTFRLRKLGDGEESNLHTFEKTDAAHKNKEEDEGDSVWKRFPSRGLSLVKGFNGDGKSESEDGKREKNTSPEEGEGKSGLRRLVGFDRLSSGPVNHVSDQVGSVHDTGDFDKSSNPVSEGHEVVVDVVKHHVGSITLRSKLSNDDVLQDHGNSGSKEDSLDPFRKSKNIGISSRSSAKSDSEVDEDNHELTAHKVSVQVVSLVSPSGDLVGDRVRFAVKFTVNWWKTNHGALSSFNHGHPDDKRPHDDTGRGRVDITGKLGVSGGDQSQNGDDGEDQEEETEYNTDPVEGGVRSMGVSSRHLEIVFF